MSKYVLSDTSCLILLHKIGKIDLLQLVYHQLVITPEIKSEFKKNLPDWVTVSEVQDQRILNKLSGIVDRGEASIIALALEKSDALLIIDDKKGRRLAHQLGIRISGTLGTLLKAKQSGHLKRIKPVLAQLTKVGYWISDSVLNDTLELAEER